MCNDYIRHDSHVSSGLKVEASHYISQTCEAFERELTSGHVWRSQRTNRVRGSGVLVVSGLLLPRSCLFSTISLIISNPAELIIPPLLNQSCPSPLPTCSDLSVHRVNSGIALANMELPATYDDLEDKRRYWPAAPGSREEGLGMLRLLTPEVVASAARAEIQTGERVCLNWDLNKLDPPGSCSNFPVSYDSHNRCRLLTQRRVRASSFPS